MDEINARLATEVMGWKFKTITQDTPFRHCISDGGYILNGKVFKFIYGYSAVHWNPKENIAHTFEVAEKMREKVYFFRLQYSAEVGAKERSDINFTWKWTAQFNSDSRDDYNRASADTPSLAISLAALEAVK